MKVVILAGGFGTRISEYTKNSQTYGKNKSITNTSSYNEALL